MTPSIAPSRGGYSTGNGGNVLPKGYSLGQIQRINPEQMNQFQELFQQMEAPAQRQFAQSQGQIASRFSGLGGGGGPERLSSRRSSGFQNFANQSASDFSQDLMSKRQDMLMKLYEQFLIEDAPEKPNFLQQLLSGLAPIAGAGIGGYLGGPGGAALGGNLGSAFGNAFR